MRKDVSRSNKLAPLHKSAEIFIDESGTARQSQFLVFGALKLTRGAGLLVNELSAFRDKANFRGEAHFVEITRDSAHLYREMINILMDPRVRFRFDAVVRDTKNDRDPFKGKEAWRAQAQEVIRISSRSLDATEVSSIVVDQISVPRDIDFDSYVRTGINRKLDRLAAVSVLRMDSRACWGLQLADILTGSVAHQYRQTVDHAAKKNSPKGSVAGHLAEQIGVSSLVDASTSSIRIAKVRSPKTHSDTGTSRRL